MAQPQVESTPNIPPTNFSWDDIKKTSCEVCDNITKNTEHYSKSLSIFKKDYIFSHASTNVRLMELGASTLLISLISWKRNLGPIRTFRNAFVGYFSIGFILVPEIYNPIIN